MRIAPCRYIGETYSGIGSPFFLSSPMWVSTEFDRLGKAAGGAPFSPSSVVLAPLTRPDSVSDVSYNSGILLLCFVKLLFLARFSCWRKNTFCYNSVIWFKKSSEIRNHVELWSLTLSTAVNYLSDVGLGKLHSYQHFCITQIECRRLRVNVPENQNRENFKK